MRFLSTRFVGPALLASTFLMGCLPSYNGDNPNDGGAKDLSQPASVDTGPPADMTPPPVTVDAMSTGELSITLDHTTASPRLNESIPVVVTITPNGQTGTATLSLANAPAGLTAVFDPASVTLGSAPVTSTMTVTAASNMTVVSNVATAVTATVGTDASTTTFGVTITPKLVVHIKKGTGANGGNHVKVGFPVGLTAKMPAGGTLPVDFYNDDDSEHQIHADGASGGMTHEKGELTVDDGPVMNNGVATGVNYYETVISTTGTAHFYCHDHGNTSATDPGTIIVQ